MQIQAINTYNNQTLTPTLGVNINKKARGKDVNFGAKNLTMRDKIKALAYIVRNRRGSQSDLYIHVDNYAVESLKKSGFISIDHTLKPDTYSVTDLGDKCYQKLHGKTLYNLQRGIGFINKMFK